MDMPDRIYISKPDSPEYSDYFWYDIEAFDRQPYTRTDLAQSLADALDVARNLVAQELDEEGETISKIDAALANYRKGE